jgi:hypothetical protein
MAITNTTDTAAIIEKRVSLIVTETLIQESVSLGAVKDYSSQIGPSMDRLDVPLYTELAVQDVSESADMTPQSINVATAQLNLNRHKSIPFSISDRASVQSKGSLVQETVKNGARSLAAEIDDFVFTGMIAAAANSVATTADPLADAANAKKLLDSANVPKSGRYMICSPGFVQALLGVNNVINADAYGSQAPIQAGFVSRLYGFTILESSSTVIANDGFIAEHMDTYAFGRQISPKFERERRVLGQRDDYALSHLYGGVVTDVSGVRIVDYTA